MSIRQSPQYVSSLICSILKVSFPPLPPSSFCFLPLLCTRLSSTDILSPKGRFDPYKYTSAQMARAHSLVVESLMDDEENQVRGYTHINDESGLTMGHLSAWSLTDIRNMLRCIQNSTPMRHKETHFVNIPSCAIKVIEFGISLLNDKLKNRIMVRTLVCAILHFSLIERSSSNNLCAILALRYTRAWTN